MIWMDGWGVGEEGTSEKVQHLVFHYSTVQRLLFNTFRSFLFCMRSCKF